ncbi:MAG TPA: EF-hand domain-containing protein, partial [Sphingomicrobium sp.]|nr:EF-hand domain-containing protein [Sphingomicrobium sp.]
RMMSRVHDAMEQRSSEHFGGRMHGPMVLNPSQMFDRLDSNHDGVISREEFMSAHARMHARMGGRQEGAATPTPGMSRHGPMLARWRSMGHEVGRGFIPRLFEMADTNHDGRVSLQEAEAAALARFDRMDLNHDGRVTPEERRQARAMMREKRPG